MVYRNEYPRPQLVRDHWENLNGLWEFQYDDLNKGIIEQWFRQKKHFDQQIEVPFVYQSSLSGIQEIEEHDIVWYRKYVKIDPSLQIGDNRLFLHFGAVDYEATVYINGELAGKHIGGCTPLTVDMTPFLVTGEQEIVVRVFDPAKSEYIPRGKQFWGGKPKSIWYTNSTGIWQTVWIEKVSKKYIESITYDVNYDDGFADVIVEASRADSDEQVKCCVSLDGQEIYKGWSSLKEGKAIFRVDVIRNNIFNLNFHEDGVSWTPEHPVLFDVRAELQDQNTCYDAVSSYFGFRKVHVEHGMIYLNNKPYYQKLVLDQGYWPESLWTAPTDEAYQKDIEASKAMGFNGCRKHQKVEDPRFLYWADHLGFLVWEECPSPVLFSSVTAIDIVRNWKEVIDRDRNHPCIIVWDTINESWGVPQINHNVQQQEFALTMYHLLHMLDSSRLVVGNDGWEMAVTDICAIHNYAHGGKEEHQKYRDFCETLSDRQKLISNPSTAHDIYIEGYSYQGEPIVLTECGGIAYDCDLQKGWGYTKAQNEDEFVEDYEKIIHAIYSSSVLWGFCYTQLTDVEQEINGLLTYGRKFKCDPHRIRDVNESYRKPFERP
jgi:beta-galactosidase/beta-glucuronidase